MLNKPKNEKNSNWGNNHNNRFRSGASIFAWGIEPFLSRTELDEINMRRNVSASNKLNKYVRAVADRLTLTLKVRWTNEWSLLSPVSVWRSRYWTVYKYKIYTIPLRYTKKFAYQIFIEFIRKHVSDTFFPQQSIVGHNGRMNEMEWRWFRWQHHGAKHVKKFRRVLIEQLASFNQNVNASPHWNSYDFRMFLLIVKNGLHVDRYQT